MSSQKSYMAWAMLVAASTLAAASGCGTTRTSNTQRTATEQLLISDAIDRAVQEIDFTKLTGQAVYFDERHLQEVVDDGYLISSLRQHLLASGCILKDQREEATFVIEPRAGAVGTDHHDLLFGIPATNVPQLTLLSGLPPAIPEVPIIKRRNQRGVAKIAVFAYRRETGEPVWQSGIAKNESTSNDIWLLGAGPFKKGRIHEGTSYGSQRHYLPLNGPREERTNSVVEIDQEAVFQRRHDRHTAPYKVPYLATNPQKQATGSPTAESQPGAGIFSPPSPAAIEDASPPSVAPRFPVHE